MSRASCAPSRRQVGRGWKALTRCVPGCGAWVGAEMGWVEFDPTNAMFNSTDHIGVAVGRDYDDVAPVRGTMRGAGGGTNAAMPWMS